MEEEELHEGAEEEHLELLPEIVSNMFLFHVGQIKRETRLSSGHFIWKIHCKVSLTSFNSIHQLSSSVTDDSLDLLVN